MMEMPVVLRMHVMLLEIVFPEDLPIVTTETSAQPTVVTL